MSKIINISMNDADFKRIDDYCVCHNLTRSKFFLQCAIEKVDVSDLVTRMGYFYSISSKIDLEGKISDEELRTLKAALRVVRGE